MENISEKTTEENKVYHGIPENTNPKSQDTIQKKMKAALYLRVSTSDQTTLNQELELKRYCDLNQLEIYNIYKDEGVSGAKTSRPQLDLMLQEMRNKSFDVVVVWKFDRLGRSTAHLLQVLEELKNKGVRLIATSQNIDTQTPMGKFFFTILSGFAEMERELIRERILLGLARRKKEVGKLGRPTGSKDKKRRTKSGYYLRWSKKTPPHKNQLNTPLNSEIKKE